MIKALICFFAIAPLAVLAAAPLTGYKPGVALPSIGPAPVWHLTDTDGHPVNSAQFKGKVLVVDFWATWCAPCREEIPGYIALQKKYGSDGLVVVGVSLDSVKPSVVKKFGADHGMNYTIVMGDDATIQAFGGVDAIPTTFLIDRHGIIRNKKVGVMPAAEYAQLVKSVLAE